MALSRLAKKLRELEPDQNSDAAASKKGKKNRKPTAPSAPVEPVAVAAPIPVAPPEPEAPPEPPKPGKRQQEKVKRPKFVYVPEKNERKPLPPKATVQPPPVTRLAARLMTQNLALPPEEEPARGPSLPGYGRL
jgi:hypothetical protein